LATPSGAEEGARMFAPCSGAEEGGRKPWPLS
jgi:hypothetical protein